jgi:iron complex transport system permease protein
VLLALVIGGSLALAGCVMQGLFRNPLADPGLLGISSGAALAVALWVVIPLSLPALVMLYAPMLAAFLGALAATVVIFLLSQQRESSLSRLLLVGIAINALCGAAVGVLSGSATMLSFASSRCGEWVALGRPSGQRFWP